MDVGDNVEIPQWRYDKKRKELLDTLPTHIEERPSESHTDRKRLYTR